MSAVIQQTVDILSKLDEDYKSFVLDFVRFIEQKQLAEKEARNTAYLAKIKRGIEQCAAGQGISHDIVEVSEDE